MVSKLQSNPLNSHDHSKKRSKMKDVGSSSADRGNYWQMGFHSCFIAEQLQEVGATVLALNMITAWQFIYMTWLASTISESHLSDFVCSVTKFLLCQPSSKSSFRFYLVNIKLNHSIFLFSLSGFCKTPKAWLGSFSLPASSSDSFLC